MKKSQFLSPLILGASLFLSSPTLPVHGETLKEYAAKCDLEIGISVPDFNCSEGTVLPTTNFVDGRCDKPNRLNQVCDPDSKLKVLHRSAEVDIVATCRRTGHPPESNNYGDIAVIQHNKVNGAACFYQALGVLDGNVLAPSKGTPAEGGWTWLSPLSTANIGCAGCHDNGPIIRSPYLTQIEGVDKLPGAGDFTYNKNNLYRFIGEDFQDWKTYEVRVENNVCLTCHRMGTNNISNGRGAALDLGIRSVAISEAAKNPHSPESPIWMTPGIINYNRDNEIQAEQIAACARRRTETPLPNEPGCTLVQYSTNTTPPDPPPLGNPGDPCGEDLIYDCVGSCVVAATAISWIGDTYCDRGIYRDQNNVPVDLVCPFFENDRDDCTPDPTDCNCDPKPTMEPGEPCGKERVYDCVGNCVDAPTANSWIGNGVCDDGTSKDPKGVSVSLICPAFENDGGDCDPIPPKPSCIEQFGQAPGFELCQESEETCSFNASTKGSCETMCNLFGSTCVTAFFNKAPGCIPDGETSCQNSQESNICVCQR